MRYGASTSSATLAHVPVLGEWLALPVVQAAGSQAIGDTVYNNVFHPHCERLLDHCDALLRVGGPSEGADRMVAAACQRGLRIYGELAEIPCVGRKLLPHGEE